MERLEKRVPHEGTTKSCLPHDRCTLLWRRALDGGEECYDTKEKRERANGRVTTSKRVKETAKDEKGKE